MALALTQLLERLDALPPRRGVPLGLAAGGVVTGLLLGPGHWLGAVLACVGVVGAFVLATTGQSRWEDTAPSPTPEPARPPRTDDPLDAHMIRLSEGEFMMGSDDAHSDESPAHRIRLSAFALGATPVTVGQWNEVMMDDPRSGDPELPVTGVSWLDAIRFCNAASARAQLQPAYVQGGVRVRWDRSADGYRLPSEAEWEYACRAGTTTRWSCGDDPVALPDYAWLHDNAGGTAHPVSTRRANPWGLYDMHGNVWEWCWDVYDAAAYQGAVEVDDPSGPVDKGENSVAMEYKKVDTVVDKPRVDRGGSFWGEAENLRSSFRYGFHPHFQAVNLGFRCARGPERQP